jgi:hypothetical protein
MPQGSLFLFPKIFISHYFFCLQLNNLWMRGTERTCQIILANGRARLGIPFPVEAATHQQLHASKEITDILRLHRTSPQPNSEEKKKAMKIWLSLFMYLDSSEPIVTGRLRKLQMRRRKRLYLIRIHFLQAISIPEHWQRTEFNK